MRVIMSTRNRNKTYPVLLQTRISDVHDSVIKAYMVKYDIDRSTATRMIIEEAARRLLDDEYRTP